MDVSAFCDGPETVNETGCEALSLEARSASVDWYLIGGLTALGTLELATAGRTLPNDAFANVERVDLRTKVAEPDGSPMETAFTDRTHPFSLVTSPAAEAEGQIEGTC